MLVNQITQQISSKIGEKQSMHIETPSLNLFICTPPVDAFNFISKSVIPNRNPKNRYTSILQNKQLVRVFDQGLFGLSTEDVG